MSEPADSLRLHALAIWKAALDAVQPQDLVRNALSDPALGIRDAIHRSRRIIVVGAGKAGSAMAAAVERALDLDLPRIEGWVNVPAETVRPLRKIHLHPARPAGSNQPTAEGVLGAEAIIALVRRADADDLLLCLFSGGGSALLPAPVEGITLADKQNTTQALHACGATIVEMNAVRKHLSRIKGGRLAEAFGGRAVYSFIISDVIGDRLDVIASGPTAPDPSTFNDAIAVLERYQLLPDQGRSERAGGRFLVVPERVVHHLKAGAAGLVPETPKRLPATVHNCIIGNNQTALYRAVATAEDLGYRVLNLGSAIQGETRDVALKQADLMLRMRCDAHPVAAPICILSGGETTVTLGVEHGLGGRNQEFVLAVIERLGKANLANCAILSGGTDGEDGPTDAAGAIADDATLRRAEHLRFGPTEFLSRHDSYHFFQATGDLLKPGLTQTNVMDVRILLLR
jgi:hydroxypyruvate reductase/glycerate 2-kinase